MSALNIVRFKVKPGREEAFVEAHRRISPGWKGFQRGWLVKTGERAYNMVGEWDSFDSLVAARPQMIMVLDGLRADLEDLGGGLGVTDAVSGTAVVEMKG